MIDTLFKKPFLKKKIGLFFRIQIWQPTVPKVCLLGLLLAFSSPSVVTITTGNGSRGRQAGYNHIINAKGLFATAIVREMGASSSRRLKGLWMVLPTKRGEKNRTPKSVRLPWEPQKLFGCLNWWWLDYKSGQESDTTTTRGDAMVRRLVFSSHVIAT